MTAYSSRLRTESGRFGGGTALVEREARNPTPSTASSAPPNRPRLRRERRDGSSGDGGEPDEDVMSGIRQARDTGGKRSGGQGGRRAPGRSATTGTRKAPRGRQAAAAVSDGRAFLCR